MQITLEQDDIEQAITEFLGSQGLDVSRMDINVDLIAGRGGNGHRAEVRLVKQEIKSREEFPTPDVVMEDPIPSEADATESDSEGKGSLFN